MSQRFLRGATRPLVLIGALSAGCQQMTADVETADSQNHESTALSAQNGLPQINGLNLYNGLNTYNGLNSFNGLTVYNGLNSFNGLNSYNGSGGDIGLMGSDGGRKTISYIIKCALPSGHQITRPDQYGNSYTFPGSIGVAPGWETGACDQTCQEAVSACVLAHVNTAGMHIPIWLDSPAPAVGWGRSSAYPNQEGTFFGNIFTTNPSTGMVDAFYCNGPGFATSVVPGRLGVFQQGAPYRNPFGQNAQCASNCVDADSGHVGDGYKSCKGYSNPVTVWRQPAQSFDPNTTYKICTAGTNNCLDGAGSGLQADWFNDPNLGNQVGMFMDDTVNFPDMTGPGNARIGTTQNFSVRWTGQVQADLNQTYTFYTMSDDGVRLWVNGQLLVDNWTGHGPTENAGSIYLSAGQWYDVKMEYMQLGYGATAQLSWSAPGLGKAIIPTQKLRPPGSWTPAGLTTEWFGDTNLSALKTSFIDSSIYMPDVTQFSQGRLGTTTNFSVRWSGQIQADFSQPYTFTTGSDDGVRLWVNGQLLVDNWTGHAYTENSGTINLVAGQWYDIKMEYMQLGAGATAELTWAAPSLPRQQIPGWKLRPYPTSGLSSQWYGDTNLGTLVGTYVDSTVNFPDTTGWGAKRAGSGSSFTVRWSGQVLADTNDTYTFTTTSDDGARLWVNGQLLVDNWTGHAPTDNSGSIYLSAGQWYDIKFEYGQIGGGGTAILSWAKTGMGKTVIPTTNLRPYPVQGGLLQQRPFSGSSGQKFRITAAADGYFTICSVATGKCLEVENARKDDGAEIRLFDNRSAAQQMWAITSVGDGNVSVVNRNSTKSLKPVFNRGGSSGVVMAQWPYLGYGDEVFTITAAP